MERFESVSNTAMDYVNQLVHSAAHTSRMFESACAAAHPHLNKTQAAIGILAAAAKQVVATINRHGVTTTLCVHHDGGVTRRCERPAATETQAGVVLNPESKAVEWATRSPGKGCRGPPGRRYSIWDAHSSRSAPRFRRTL